MAPMAGSLFDCTDAIFRITLFLERYPQYEPMLGPTIPLMQGVREGVSETLGLVFDFWNGNFMEPLEKLGFKDPEEAKVVKK